MVVKSDGSGGGAFVAEHVAPAGYAVPMHVHERDDEMFYVLEGELVLEDGSGVRRAGPGSFVALPKGVPHAFRNESATEVRFLVVTSPGVATAEMFRHFDRAGSPAPEEIGAISAQYGVLMR